MSDSELATAADPGSTVLPLHARVPPGGTNDADEILDLFIGWVSDLGFELFPAQEEALLELMAGRHVILNTPTGSGKSLVAAGLHFKGFCEGKVSYYTCPIKALANEKFFALCNDFGAENVGMRTGDASINPEAPIICCTAEVLSNMALRYGSDLGVDYVVMDEFHYYGDPDRGVAWQVPLIVLPDTAFLLMSATIGNPAPIQERLDKQTSRTTAIVSGSERPVPLEFEYRETPIHETVQDLLDSDRAPIYVVNFTQRECAELAQSLTSLKLLSKEEKARLLDAIGDFHFDTAYGKEMRRFLTFGVGVHHAGLLPKYRLLVEQLSQQSLLKAICGTDTLGVGVNIPIRTVLFRKLSKFDGEKVALLRVRDFKQIAGRAGRKGFDDKGWVVCQAPEHEIENQRRQQKANKGAKRSKGLQKKKPPRDFVPWNKQIFEQLITRPPETLESQFRIGHGMVLNLIQHDEDKNEPGLDNFASIRRIIRNCHADDATKQRLLSGAAVLILSLYRAGILVLERDTRSSYYWVTVNRDLQIDFSLHQNLSLYLVEVVDILDRQDENYGLDVLSLAEAILEDPKVVLWRQIDKIKDELVARMKADGIPYEERMEKLETVTHPKPNAELIYRTFETFRQQHPWVAGDNIRPKGVGREIYENYLSFDDFVRRYGLQRSEGVLLRYLSQLYRTVTQTVPEQNKTDEVFDMLGFFRTLLTRVDTSLLREWESLLDPETGMSRLAGTDEGLQRIAAFELLEDPRAFRARIRAELHQLVRALAARDFEEAQRAIRPGKWQRRWSPEELETALAPFFDEYEEMVFTPEARQAHFTRLDEEGHRRWRATQVLLDPEGDHLWHIEATVDLSNIEPGQLDETLAAPLIAVERIGT